MRARRLSADFPPLICKISRPHERRAARAPEGRGSGPRRRGRPRRSLEGARAGGGALAAPCLPSRPSHGASSSLRASPCAPWQASTSNQGSHHVQRGPRLGAPVAGAASGMHREVPAGFGRLGAARMGSGSAWMRARTGHRSYSFSVMRLLIWNASCMGRVAHCECRQLACRRVECDLCSIVSKSLL